MIRSASVAIFSLALFAQVAAAFEYPLQFTPNPGYQGLVVAGYKFVGDTVVGNCSYFTVHSGSGRGGGYRSVTTYFDQTCTWDMHGNLLSVTPGAPTVPAPLAYRGSETIYAVTPAGNSTGTDPQLKAAGFSGGFVDTPGSHYTWVSGHVFDSIRQGLTTLTATLKSDGEAPLNIASVSASALNGRAAIDSTTCSGEFATGSTCTVTVTYDSSTLCAVTLVGSDTLRISVTSDAGQASDFVQLFLVLLRHRSNGCPVNN